MRRGLFRAVLCLEIRAIPLMTLRAAAGGYRVQGAQILS